jgi:nucleotide-binding universal stress UspA family protein
VTYPAVVAEEFPDHVTNATIHARLISDAAIINVDVSLHHDSQLGGYVGSFDVRDPGPYTLQVVVAWFFGASEPGTSQPLPVLVGTHVGHEASRCSFARALVEGGSPIGLVLDDAAANTEAAKTRPRFGTVKCRSADVAGRWLDMRGIGECHAPYCSGSRHGVLGDYDWVRMCCVVLCCVVLRCVALRCVMLCCIVERGSGAGARRVTMEVKWKCSDVCGVWHIKWRTVCGDAQWCVL